MKYIAVLFILILMSWTWSLATSERSFTLEQYKQVEGGVEQDIRGFIMRKYPDVKEIVCLQLYTEAVTPGTEMIAHFRCQAATNPEAEEVTQQTFEGFLRLKSSDGFKTWSETGGEILSPEVTFLKGVRITPERSGERSLHGADSSAHETAAPEKSGVKSGEPKANDMKASEPKTGDTPAAKASENTDQRPEKK